MVISTSHGMKRDLACLSVVSASSAPRGGLVLKWALCSGPGTPGLWASNKEASYKPMFKVVLYQHINRVQT